MKKNKVELVLAEFSACLLVSPFGINSDIASVSQCQMLFMSGPQRLFKATSAPQCVVVSSGFGWSWDEPKCVASLALGPGPRVVVSANALPDLPLLTSASRPAASLSLVTEPTVSERASGATRGMGCLILP